jgi:hypothetical protein
LAFTRYRGFDTLAGLALVFAFVSSTPSGVQVAIMDFEIERSSRVCARSGRHLAEGETFHSVLVRREGKICREDFGTEAWTGPPEDAVACWTSRVPPRHARPKLAPRDVVLRLFEELQHADQQADLRYVLALWLLRRRILKLERPDGEAPRAATSDMLVLYDPNTETVYRVPVAVPTAQRAAQIDQVLAELLDCERTGRPEPAAPDQPRSDAS